MKQATLGEIQKFTNLNFVVCILKYNSFLYLRFMTCSTLIHSRKILLKCLRIFYTPDLVACKGFSTSFVCTPAISFPWKLHFKVIISKAFTEFYTHLQKLLVVTAKIDWIQCPLPTSTSWIILQKNVQSILKFFFPNKTIHKKVKSSGPVAFSFYLVLSIM